MRDIGLQGDESDPVCVLLMENFTVNPDPMQVCILEIENHEMYSFFYIIYIQELQSFTVTFKAEEVNELSNTTLI